MHIPTIVIRGAGDLATGVALRLYRAGFTHIVHLEVPAPLAVRRNVCFCEAIYQQRHTVEDVTARFISTPEAVTDCWANNDIAVLADPAASLLAKLQPEILIDAIIAKKNIGTNLRMADLVIGLGPGFTAQKDVHAIVETKRGHSLGRVIREGTAIPNTGIPGAVKGYTTERVYWAPCEGVFTSSRSIGEFIQQGDALGTVGNTAVTAQIDGLIRGLLPDGTYLKKGTKVGDIDPRNVPSYCHYVSDKALSVGGGVLEAVSAYMLGAGQKASTGAIHA